MRNNRGQFFGIYLVALTLVMCGVVVGLFYVQQGNALNSLVSPKAVLDVRDGLEIFEMREMNLIKESFVAVDEGIDFCSGEFAKAFQDSFIDKVLLDEEMKEFVFDGLIFGGTDVESSARSGSEDFFRNILYSGEMGDCVDDARVFSRVSVGKFARLKASDQGKINFPIDFNFEFEGKYSIDKNGKVVKL